MVQSKEEHRRINRENMRKTNANRKAAALAGDEAAIASIQKDNEYHKEYNRKRRSDLKTRADKGDLEAKKELDKKDKASLLSFTFSFIENRADLKQLDELETLVNIRRQQLSNNKSKGGE